MDGDLLKANRWAWGEVKKHEDRLIAAGNLFPAADNALELLKVFKEEGIKLAKVHPSLDVHDVSSPKAYECYALAAELGITLDYHTGPHGTRLSLTQPFKFDDIAWDFPELKLVFEHLGGRTYFEEFMAILASHNNVDSNSRPQVYGGVASVFTPGNIWYLGPEKIFDVITYAGAKKLIYGLDFPWNSKETNKNDIKLIKQLAISDDDKNDILGNNLLRLLDA
jgi:predicted TIM-barrel fold metal-dependent hydrolase